VGLGLLAGTFQQRAYLLELLSTDISFPEYLLFQHRF
jgi:hypothetical protein